jgi:hypothetical protein
MLSISGQNRVNAFYRRCLRLIFCTYRALSNDLHESLKLLTLKENIKDAYIKE